MPLVRRATEADIGETVDVLREGAAYMRTVEAPAWDDARIGPDFVASLVGARELIVASSEGRIAGCLAMQTRDGIFWADRPGDDAFYLHKIAVRRAFAGQGVVDALIEWVCAEARATGRAFLRLDCANKPRLRARYERLGFRKVDDFFIPWSEVGEPHEGVFHTVRHERQL